MSDIILISIGILFFIIGFFIFKKINSTKQKLYIAQRNVIDILEEYEGSKIDIRPYNKEEASNLYSGILKKITERYVIVESNSLIPKRLEGQIITVYLRILRGEEEIFRWFRSRIDNISSKIMIDLPAKVDIGQKRFFKRGKISPNDINIIRLWKFNENLPLPENLSEVGVSLCVARPNNWNFAIANISASGVALSFPMNLSQKLQPYNLLIGDSILLFLAFRYPKEEETNFLWMSGQILHQRINANSEFYNSSKEMIMSVKFSSWALQTDENASLKWNFITENHGVDPIIKIIGKD